MKILCQHCQRCLLQFHATCNIMQPDQHILLYYITDTDGNKLLKTYLVLYHWCQESSLAKHWSFQLRRLLCHPATSNSCTANQYTLTCNPLKLCKMQTQQNNDDDATVAFTITNAATFNFHFVSQCLSTVSPGYARFVWRRTLQMLYTGSKFWRVLESTAAEFC